MAGAKSLAEDLKAHGVEASRTNTWNVPPEALTLITDRSHPLYDERVHDPVDEESDDFKSILGSSPDTGGVRQAIFIQRDGRAKDGTPALNVVAGRQRTKMARRANEIRKKRGWPLLSVPVKEVRGTSGEMVLIALEENALRKAETPWTLAVKADIAIRLGESTERVARACGLKTPAVLEKYLLLINMDPKVQQAFHKGELGAGVIGEWADIPRAEQAARLEAVRASGATKNHEVRAVLTAAAAGKAYKPPTSKKMLGRPQLEGLGKALAQRHQEAKGRGGVPVREQAALSVAAAVVDFITSGDAGALAEFPEVRDVITSALKGGKAPTEAGKKRAKAK